MLTVAAGCDKRAEPPAPQPSRTSLAGRPTVLFLLFGDRADPRVLPVATLAQGRVTPISLDPDGWRSFDRLYFRTGSRIAVYRRGSPAGEAVVRRGMWNASEPLYKLPRCRALRPLAAATLTSAPPDVVMLEVLGTSAPMGKLSSRTPTTPADLDSARAFAERAARRAGLTTGQRSNLELTVSALRTGVSGWPTLVASFADRGARPGGGSRHLFVVADSSTPDRSYAPSFTHAARDSVPEFRRLIDHFDLTGDGADELVVEGWKQGGESYLIVLKYTAGRWREIARGANSWCADPPKI